MRFILTVFLSIGLIACLGAIYQETQPDGDTTYSDTPLPNGEKIDIKEKNFTTPAAKPNSTIPITTTPKNTPTNAPENADIAKDYVAFDMISPKNEDTFQNQPTIPFNMKVDPPLKQGDLIQVFIDDTPWGSTQRTSTFELPKVNRGAHKVYAVLLNKDQQVIKQTAVITIYLHYAHIPYPVKS